MVQAEENIPEYMRKEWTKRKLKIAVRSMMENKRMFILGAKSEKI